MTSPSETVRLLRPHSEVEGRGIELALKDAGIEPLVLPRKDRSYPGVADRGQPWGEIRVLASQLEPAQQVLEQWREAEVEDLEEAYDRSQSEEQEPSHPQAPTPPAPWLAAVLSFALPGLGQLYVREPLRAAVWMIAALVAYGALSGLLLVVVPVLAAVDAVRLALGKNRTPPPPPGEGPYRKAGD
jgi:hypothetical protein